MKATKDLQHGRPLKINNAEVELHLDDQRHPKIAVKGLTYSSLHKLVVAYPELSEAKNIKTLAQLSNFLFQGHSYQFIDDISAFKEAYLNQIEFDKNSMDYMPSRLIDHGIFDVNIMKAPSIENGEFIFYVKEDRTGIPYRVSCPYPFEDKPKATYHLLPYAV